MGILYEISLLQKYCCLADITEPGLSGEEAINKQTAFLDKALVLGKETKALDLRSKIHYSLFVLFRKKKEYAEGLNNPKAYNATEKEIHSNVVKQKVLSLRSLTRSSNQVKKRRYSGFAILSLQLYMKK